MSDPTNIRDTLTARIKKLNAVPNIRIANVGPNPLVLAEEANRASEFYKRLAETIEQFDADLDNEHEVGVRLVSFGQSVVFHLQDMGYSNPSLLFFFGVMDDGSPVQLIQHVSQISVLLIKLPRKDPTKPKQPFGFATGVDQEGQE